MDPQLRRSGLGAEPRRPGRIIQDFVTRCMALDRVHGRLVAQMIGDDAPDAVGRLAAERQAWEIIRTMPTDEIGPVIEAAMTRTDGGERAEVA